MNNCLNVVKLQGKIINKPIFIKDYDCSKLYSMIIGVNRLSGINDIINIIYEELTDNNFQVGDEVYIEGNFRSINKIIDEKSHLILYVYANKIEKTSIFNKINQVQLKGFICKQPIFRSTPLGKNICDIKLAVNRQNGKSDYFPCIVWGKNAKIVKNYQIGDFIEIEGRLQSRTYIKIISEIESKQKLANEISVSKINKIENE